MSDPRNEHRTATARTADALVIFGITGDLARKMTLRSLYRLESRGLLHTPIVGVAIDDWDAERLRAHARDCIAAAGETIDDAVFSRLAARLEYVGGDFAEPATYARLATTLGTVAAPVFYLEVPPSLFGMVVGGLAKADLLPTQARVVVEKPFGHDLASARALAVELHEHLDESQLYRIDHFLGKMGLDEILYLRFANALIAPAWDRHHIASVQITMAERFGVQDRGAFYDPVGALRDVVVNHLLQIVSLVAMEAPSGRDPATIKDAKLAVFRAIADVEPAACVRGQHDGYRDIDGVARDSDTETYVALRLDIDSPRWSGVPFLIRAGKRLPVTQTELRIVFQQAVGLGFLPEDDRPPVPSQLVIRIDPHTGVRLILDARRADAVGPEEIDLDMRFADEGGAGPTPYEVLLDAALRGDSSQFTRQDGVEETWRIIAPLLEHPPPAQPYAPGSWGPAAADALPGDHGQWRSLWLDA